MYWNSNSHQSTLNTREILGRRSRERSFPRTESVNEENGARIGLARERAQTYKSFHGPNHSYYSHSFVSRSFPDGRVRLGLSVAWRPGHSSHHHIDPVFDRSLVKCPTAGFASNPRKASSN